MKIMAPNSDSSKSTYIDLKSDLIWKTFIKFHWPREKCESSIARQFFVNYSTADCYFLLFLRYFF